MNIDLIENTEFNFKKNLTVSSMNGSPLTYYTYRTAVPTPEFKDSPAEQELVQTIPSYFNGSLLISDLKVGEAYRLKSSGFVSGNNNTADRVVFLFKRYVDGGPGDVHIVEGDLDMDVTPDDTYLSSYTLTVDFTVMSVNPPALHAVMSIETGATVNGNVDGMSARVASATNTTLLSELPGSWDFSLTASCVGVTRVQSLSMNLQKLY